MNKKTVVVGISGGVDSSVAAYLLKKDYNVIGLFMRNWDSSVNGEFNYNEENNICPQEVDYNDAKMVCEKLGIELHRVDFIKEYWDDVFTYFLDELKKGRTPNPDLFCNRYIKFDLFLKEAKKLGADYVATGHYAKIEKGTLLRAKDENKDQTYFLAQVGKEAFENILFPLGDLTKTEVREIAAREGLITANKKDSTGICFIGERNFQKFIQNFLKPNPGDIIDIDTGKVIGRHNGLMNYTIGQRRNVGLSGFKDKHYVVGKNVSKNLLYVAFGDDPKTLYSDKAVLSQINLLTDEKIDNCTAKFRYRSKDIPVKVTFTSPNKMVVEYSSLVKGVTPGQACVLYDGEKCLGSGIIDEVYLNDEKLNYL